MKIPASTSPLRTTTLIASVMIFVLVCLFSQATQSTVAGFTARITNPTNAAGTASYFTCTAAYTADNSSALFAYKLDEAATTPGTPVTSATYEAESATLSGGAVVNTDHTGYSGTGFVAGYTDAYKGTAKTVFTIGAAGAGTYSLALRYANANGTAKTISVQVDSTPVQQLTLPATSSWNAWSTHTVNATLAAGSHTVAYSSGTADTGNINLDYIHVAISSAAITTDSFPGTGGAALQNRTGEVGAAWTKQTISSATDDAVLTAAGRLRKSSSSTYASLYTSSAAPGNGNYAVSADVEHITAVTRDVIGVVGRLDTTNANGTYYLARYEQAATAFILYRVVNGVFTSYGGWGLALENNSTHRLTLDMNGTTIRLLVDGVQRVSATDGAISGPGRAGVALGFGYTTAQVMTTITDTTGMHLDNFSASFASGSSPATATTSAIDFSSKGANGIYQGAMTTRAAPTRFGCPRDAGGAYVLDGSTGYVTNPTMYSGTNVFTEEIWFNTTVAGGRLIGFGNAATGLSSTFDRIIYMSDAGQLLFGVYNTTTSTITSPARYDDGRWHHAAATLSPAGMVLYVDGKIVATNPTVTTAEPNNAYWRIGYDNISGWPSAPTNRYFAGSMRFAAVYTTALSATQIANHYASGQ